MHRFLSCLAATLALAPVLLASAGAAHAQGLPRLASITVAGLPPGLDINMRVLFPVCDGTVDNGVGFTVPMTADTEIVLEPFTLNGHQAFIGRRVPIYRAQPVTVPQNPNCPPKRSEFVAQVSGVDGGQPLRRQLHLLDVFPTGDNLTVRIEPRASTLLIRDGDRQTLSTLTRNTEQVVMALLQTPSKAPGLVNAPSLALQFPAQPQNGFPLPDVVVRFFERRIGNLTGACIEKDGRVACQQLGLSGEVRPAARLDGFECSLATAGGRLDAQGRPTAFFRFKLPLSLRVGQMELSVSANDSDLSTYTVNGSQQALDLLPWRPLNMPIFIQ